MNLQVFKLDLEKAEEPEIKLPASAGSWKKQESSRQTSTPALLTTPKPLTLWITANAKVFNCVDHNKLWKILKEMGIPDHFTCFLRNLYAGPVANWLSEEALQIAEERREVKIKRERERY